MVHINIEIKAKCSNAEKIREILKSKNADFKGIDHQIDTYFQTNFGRLKLREGNIEKSLIYYNREDKEGPKQSNVTLLQNPPSILKEILNASLGNLIVVDKKREIYFVDNIKFHIDEVRDLGSFVEIEAIDKNETIGKEKLLKQCEEYLKLFDISNENLVPVSYSDLLLNKK